MQLDLVTVAVIAANVLGGAMALPQAMKLLRTRQVDGVSPAWAAISACVNAGWVVYGLGVGDMGIVPVSVVSVLAYLAIAAGLVRFGTAPRWRALATMGISGIAVAVVPAVAFAVAGWAAFGIALGAVYGIQLSPAVVAVYRSADVSGVSAATWAMAFAEAVLWGLYGLPRGDAGLVALAATGSTMSALVLARLYVRRPRHDRTTLGAPMGLSPA